MPRNSPAIGDLMDLLRFNGDPDGNRNSGAAGRRAISGAAGAAPLSRRGKDWHAL